MASGNSRRTSISYSDSGVSVNTTLTTANSRYACYWNNNCRGLHELNDCRARERDLRGKLGIYYSPNGSYRRFTRDEANDSSLESNPTGCTKIHLLLHKKENNETWLLFVTKSVKEKRQDTEEGSIRQSLLTLPSSNPIKKDEYHKQVAERALRTVTDENDIVKDYRPHLKRFLFVDANSVYPFYLSNEQANLLTRNFTPNDEISSIHWFPLSTVLNCLPEWNDYLSRQENGRELAQVRHPNHAGIRLIKENEQHTLWSVTATCLMCIRNHVGFEPFLQP